MPVPRVGHTHVSEDIAKHRNRSIQKYRMRNELQIGDVVQLTAYRWEHWVNSRNEYVNVRWEKAVVIDCEPPSYYVAMTTSGHCVAFFRERVQIVKGP